MVVQKSDNIVLKLLENNNFRSKSLLIADDDTGVNSLRPAFNTDDIAGIVKWNWRVVNFFTERVHNN